MTATIELNFYKFKNNFINKFKLSFQNETTNIKLNEYKYTIPETLFNYNKHKILLYITLFSDYENFDFNFYIYKGENKVYIQLDYLFKTVFELIIKSHDKYKITQINKDFTKLDSLGNKYRKRLTLINTDPSICINGDKINLMNIVQLNYNIKEKELLFFQISTELKENKGQYFIIKNIKENQNIIDFSVLKKNEENLENFMIDLENILKKQNYFLHFEKLKKNYNEIFKIKLPKLNKDNEYINNLCKINNLTNLNTFYDIHFIEFFLVDNKLRTPKLLLSLLNKLNKEKNLINSKNIDMDEKLKILNIYFLLYSDCNSIEEVNSINIKNFIISENQNNSINFKISKFFEEFLELLNEDSEIFFYLLQIDSGIGYFHKEKVYTFDLTNLDMMKNHLKRLFPKSLTFYNYGNGIAFCSSLTGGIALNENYLLYKDQDNIDYNLNILNENESNDIAIDIALYLIHEYMGHKKFSHSEEAIDSPKKILKNNKLIKLMHEKDYIKNNEDCEYILTSNAGKNKGDSGHFLELCFHNFYNDSIFKLLLSLKKKGKLIKRPDLFINSTEKLEKYVILKKIAEEKNIQLQSDDKNTIENEIEYLNSIIDLEKYKKEKQKKEEERINIKSENKKKNKSKKYMKFISKKKVEKYCSLGGKNKKEDCEEDSEEEDSEESNEEKGNGKEDKRYKMILKKFNFKNDEELSFNVEQKLKETDLSQEDYDDLYYLHFKFLKKY